LIFSDLDLLTVLLAAFKDRIGVSVGIPNTLKI
jgi:hypothetical protein